VRGGFDSYFADWSADGKRVLYRIGQSSLVTPGLRSVSVAGGKPAPEAEAATRRLRARDGYDFYPSPDGKWIAAIAEKKDVQSMLITKTTGSKVITLVRRDAQSHPIWSPDSRHILFNRDDGVYVIRREGGQARRLAPYSTDRAVGWSPDGRKILIIRQVEDKERPNKTWSELWVMDADGSRPTRLPFNRKHWSVLDADWDTPRP
jgi:Tol biopolymer transport system component